MDRYEALREKLIKYNQEHLLDFYSELDEFKKEELLNQIENIDLDKITKLYNTVNYVENNNDEIDQINHIDKLKLSVDEIDKYLKIGENSIKEGEFAFVTLAGGQGTRLGHNGPKGTYELEITPKKSLFEIIAGKLIKARNEYGVYINWYIMTSRENNDDTIKFFDKNNYFGYPKECVSFFKQEELPMVKEDGKIILEEKHKVKEAADGHGGVFNSMDRNGIINDMESKGIKWIFIGGIDNVLLKIVDPLFIGLAVDANVKLAGKSIIKSCPEEKVGVFCKRNKRPSVIEYSEITSEMANMLDSKGELVFGESHILCNLFSIEALKLIAKEKLPYHTAFKKSEYIDRNGACIMPTSPNAYKFETFIFDAFSKFDDMLIFRVLREEEFAPVKNKEGVDSPETAIKLYNAYYNK